MDKIRAKFHINAVKKTEPHEYTVNKLDGTGVETRRDDGCEVVEAHPVYSGSEENKDFSKYTPCGDLSLTITNPAAFGFFQEGKEYYLDFTPAAE